MTGRHLLAMLGGWLALAAPAAAQFKSAAADHAKPGEIVTQRWRIGLAVTAEGGGFRRIVGTTTVPTDWPEQRVRVLTEDLSPGVTVSYQAVEGMAKQMTVKIPALGVNETSQGVVTFEVRRALLPPPTQTADYVLPDPKKLDRKLAGFLQPSPYIESNHPDVKRLADQLLAKPDKAWEKVEALYDWVRKHIEFKDNQGQGVKVVLETLNDGHGDCDEMSSAFIALCRSSGIPARLVRVPGHVYAEFYLLTDEEQGRWFPCQLAGTRGFGGIVDPRPILQKGDNVLAADPHTGKKVRSRFLTDHLIGMPVGPGGSLKLKVICDRAE